MTYQQKYRSERALTLMTVFGVIFVLGLALGGWVFSSYQEARTYERLTGKHVTTWDAMWVDLRVQEQVR